MLPAIAVLRPIRREGQHVIRSLANSAQDCPALGGEGLGELLAEVRRRQRHAAYLGRKRPRVEHQQRVRMPIMVRSFSASAA